MIFCRNSEQYLSFNLQIFAVFYLAWKEFVEISEPKIKLNNVPYLPLKKWSLFDHSAYNRIVAVVDDKMMSEKWLNNVQGTALLFGLFNLCNPIYKNIVKILLYLFNIARTALNYCLL